MIPSFRNKHYKETLSHLNIFSHEKRWSLCKLIECFKIFDGSLDVLLRGLVASLPSYYSAGPGSNSGRGSRHMASSCSSSLTARLINGYVGKPGKGKLWWQGCHSGRVSRGNGLPSTTRSRTDVTEMSNEATPCFSVCSHLYLHLYQRESDHAVCDRWFDANEEIMTPNSNVDKFILIAQKLFFTDAVVRDWNILPSSEVQCNTTASFENNWSPP